MAKTKKVVNGKLEVTETETIVSKVETLTKDDLIGLKAEVQTKIDHMQIDLDVLVAERDDIQASIDLLP